MAKGCIVFRVMPLGCFLFILPNYTMHFLFALFSEDPEGFLPNYSQTAILHTAPFRRVVNTHNSSLDSTNFCVNSSANHTQIRPWKWDSILTYVERSTPRCTLPPRPARTRDPPDATPSRPIPAPSHCHVT